jgi:hypothetical protein
LAGSKDFGSSGSATLKTLGWGAEGAGVREQEAASIMARKAGRVRIRIVLDIGRVYSRKSGKSRK